MKYSLKRTVKRRARSLDDQAALKVYCDFSYLHENGVNRRTILTRRIRFMKP